MDKYSNNQKNINANLMPQKDDFLENYDDSDLKKANMGSYKSNNRIPKLKRILFWTKTALTKQILKEKNIKKLKTARYIIHQTKNKIKESYENWNNK